jgi:signal transduction histidine kinase/ActR/RegA family two-component response regulator
VVALNPTLIRRESCGCSHSRSDRFRSEHPPGLEGWQLDRALSEQKGALAERLLSSIPIPEEEFSHWAERLIDALFLEVQGAKGHFVGVLEEILRTAEWRLWLVDELQNAISLLRMYLRNTQWNNDINLEDIWHDARIILSDGAAHGQVKRRVDADLTSNLFLTRSAAVLPGSLTRAALIEAISKEFEAIGIENGAVFVFSKIASKKEESLECIVRIHNGLSWARPDETGYSVDTIVSSFVDAERRTSLVVIPLSSAAESVGVMILELGAPDLYYEMLREHMSSYLKSVSYYQDHVDKLLAEADEKRRELEMQHRQKLESLGVLAGGIAHDFNNMLSAMAGNLDIALLDLEEGLDCREPIMECKEVTNHASGLCKQLLAYSGKGDFVIKRMNLNQIIQDLSTLLKMSISKSVNLIFEFEHRLPDIEGDVDQINQVFLNLVVNASEAMEPSGGTITVRTYSEYRSMADFNESFFVGSQMEPGEYVIARVSDTGAGIEKDQLLQIFDPFFTTKFTGRGLGLAAVSGIVRGHRGGINVRSKKGSGTCFELLFPLIPRFSVVPKLTSVPPVWKGSGTILLVDDEPTVLRAGERLLKRMGFEVLLARDGQAAIDVFQKLGERISCVILDITMPGMGGVATMAELKKMRTAVPVILSSGYSEEQVIDSLDDAAPTAFLQKPYDFEKLARILQLALKTDSRPNSDGILI